MIKIILEVPRNVRNIVKKMKDVHFGPTFIIITEEMKVQMSAILRKKTKCLRRKCGLHPDLKDVEVRSIENILVAEGTSQSQSITKKKKKNQILQP